jgi:hypothetical protein
MTESVKHWTVTAQEFKGKTDCTNIYSFLATQRYYTLKLDQ